MRRLLAALLFALAIGVVHAQAVRDATPLEFRDEAEARRFHDLVAELRCVMCQNQSLADSNAQIAHDLRREVFELMREGRSDAEIRDYLVDRYGEFVLYRPRFGGHTWLLWLGPALVLLAGSIVVARVVRSRSRQPLPPEEDQEW
ncbi:cytochrome c-type biogenesis protein CcmH [Luteimonas wenzhouensis]|uniref:Cytochrome c-type biogenesis protein n=1 Tax=Luteimonas wenzhouensis TaxID=2599615 RepID=A0A5C5TVI7_9GAMM|nr:cytochrome c-type biogenesis protein [Luteimonas wenzhouensis]TWT17230.1 cytochrome c-type biogenesis protein CcmH [Luteimonas wenzhouensis]